MNQTHRFRAILSWVNALIVFFPIIMMLITSFKTEQQAIAVPPTFIFEPTVENYGIVQERSDYLKFAKNSVITAFGSTILALIIAIPAAYSMAFYPGKRTKDMLLWMLSTKMLPAVGVLVPIYILCKEAGLLDSSLALTIIYTLINLPIIVWMLFSYFKDIPKDILEAVRLDGASTLGEIRHVLLPLSFGGIASTALLSIVLSWNEAFGLST